MAKIFLSYRRDDSADIAGRIFDHLERRFGRERLFLDVDAIRYGDDFRRRIGNALDQTSVLLAIIGDHWLDAEDETRPQRRRLDDPNDYVGFEIASALERGITIVPVLVGDARMPSADDLPARLADLSYRNAAEVRSGRDFGFQIGRLIDAIAELLDLPAAPPSRGAAASHAIRVPISFATLAAAPARLVGVQLGAFVVERLLASGGSGVAYIGRNPRTGQRVCIKVSLPVLSDMEALRRALSRGIRGLVTLNHPHIVRIHEFDGLELTDAASFYVAMDYVQGPTFDAWADDLPSTPDGVRRFVRMGSLIARALEAAHTCRYRDDVGFETVGVMHGDVKPGNIVVRPDDTPALMDFMMVDIQRALDPAARERFSDEVSTAVFGTPGFMAPEQEHEGIVTARTDVYGLGATLRAAGQALPLPADLLELFDRMTGPLERRPQDMHEVAAALADIAADRNSDAPTMREREPSPAGASAAALHYAPVPNLFQLRILAGPDAGTIHELTLTRITVGRAAHNDVVLREPSLSRSHIALNWSPELRTFVAIDFGAHNPLLVNGEPLADTRALRVGDVLSIGSTSFVFEAHVHRTPDRSE